MSLLHLTEITRKEHADLFNLMLEEVQDYAIFTIDTKGVIVSWNPGARYLLGYTKNEVIGQPLSVLFPKLKKNSHLHQDLEMAIKKGQYEHVTQVIKKNKKKIFVNCVVTALWGRDNRLKGFSKIVQDITPQMEAEKKREEFISMAGHEVKNPLTSIKAYLQLLEMKFNKKGETEFLPIITKTIAQVDKLANLLRDILDASKIAIGKLPFHDKDNIHLDDFLREISETVQISYPNHTIVLEKKPHITLHHIDKERLEQVILNLLLNAVKYSPENRKILVSVKEREGEVVISVKDKGIGIAKKDQTSIFEKFYRGNNAKKMQQGLGLGLHLAQEIINHYKGKIWVESEKGKGSTFYILFPQSISH